MNTDDPEEFEVQLRLERHGTFTIYLVNPFDEQLVSPWKYVTWENALDGAQRVAQFLHCPVCIVDTGDVSSVRLTDEQLAAGDRCMSVSDWLGLPPGVVG